MRGLFVTFEGGEGSGKTTQLKLLANRIRASGQEVIESHDPGGTGIGKEIRTLLLDPGPAPISAATELLLYEASRAQLVRELIAPALARGTIVLCDRFTDSTVAYQGCGRGIDRDLIRQLNRFATDGLVPDLTILLDLDPEIGLARCGRTRVPMLRRGVARGRRAGTGSRLSRWTFTGGSETDTWRWRAKSRIESRLSMPVWIRLRSKRLCGIGLSVFNRCNDAVS